MKKAFIKHIFIKLLPAVVIMCIIICAFYVGLHHNEQKEFFYTKVSDIYNIIYAMDNMTDEVNMINENEAISKASKAAGIFEYNSDMSYGDLKREIGELGIRDIYIFDKEGMSLFENSSVTEYLSQSDIYKNALFNISSVSEPQTDYAGENVIYAAVKRADGNGAVIVSVPCSDLAYFQRDKGYYDILSFMGIGENETVFIADAETKDIIACIGGVGKMSAEETVKNIISPGFDIHKHGGNSLSTVVKVSNVKLLSHCTQFGDVIIGYVAPWSSFSGKSGILIMGCILFLIIITAMMILTMYRWLDKTILVKFREVINELDALASGKALDAHIRMNYDIEELMALCGNINLLIDALNGVYSEKYRTLEETQFDFEKQDMFFAERQIFSDIADRAVNDEQIENKIKNEFFKGLAGRVNLHTDIVMALCELALLKFSDDNTYAYVSDIKTAVSDITLLLENITDIFEMDLGKPEIEYEDYFTGSLINDIVDENNFIAHRRNIEIRTEIGEDIPARLNGDKFRVYKIVSNILRTFIYSSENCSVLISVQREELANNLIKLIFSVSCSGTEVKPETFREALKPSNFFKMEKLAQPRGSVEIKIASRVAAMLGGEVDIEETHKNGSAFSAYVIQKPAEDNSDSKEMQMSDHMNLFTAPDAKVIIIDENKIYAGMIAECLKIIGIKADLCIDVKKAEDMVKNTGYDLIFISQYKILYQPDQKCCEALIEKLRIYDIPIIALISDKTEKAKKELISRGAAYIMIRPLNLSLMADIVRHSLPERLIKKEKEAENTINAHMIEGINVERGLAECGQSMDIYVDLMKIFCESLEKNLSNIEASKEEDDFMSYRKYIDDIKTASADIGAERLAHAAVLLRRAADERNGVFISMNNSKFVRYAERIIAAIKDYLKKQNN